MGKGNLYLAATVACLTGALFGYSVGFIGGIIVLPSFQAHFGLDQLPPKELASSQAAVVTAWIVGALFGVPMAMPICSKWGRKPCLMFAAGLYVLGAVCQLIDVQRSLGLFEAGRLMNGLGVGAGTLVSPIYIAEISRPDDRGVLMSGFQVAVQVCALVGFWGAFASNALIADTSNFQWQIPVAIQLLPGAILVFGALYIPETPHYLTTTGTEDDVKKALAWLRGLDENDTEVLFEAHEMESNALASARMQQFQRQSSFLREALSKPVRRRLGVGIGLMIAQNMVGLNALNYYAAVIFMTAGFKSISSSLFLTGIFGLVKVIASASFMFLFVRVKGNRFWLLLGSTVCGLCMFILAYCVGTMPSSTSGDTLTVKGAVAVLMVYIFAFFFGISLGPISWNVCSEIFPSRINAKCCMVTTCTQWLFQIVIASITPMLLTSVGSLTFVVYGTCCAISLVWCALYVPETRGVAIGSEMDHVFGQYKDGAGAVVEEIEDVSEETPLIASRRRRRSSVAIVV